MSDVIRLAAKKAASRAVVETIAAAVEESEGSWFTVQSFLDDARVGTQGLTFEVLLEASSTFSNWKRDE